MIEKLRWKRIPGSLVIASALVLAGTYGTAITAAAQDFDDLQAPQGALVLKAQGSFFVGGENVEQTFTELGSAFAPGHITVNQMYVEYMIPAGSVQKVPVVIVHGATLSGKSWETTPDGRMGWDEYFVRQGHAVYLADQISRARSGFNQAIFNKVGAEEESPASQPSILRFTDETAWEGFRFGSTFGTAYADAQFPTEAADEFSKQGIPDLNSTLPSPNPNFNALSDLAIKLGGAVVMGHSQSGRYPLDAALTDSTGMKGLIVTEPAFSCRGATPDAYTNDEIATLATVPILVLFGDHLSDPPFGVLWQPAFDDCEEFITRINNAGGNAEMLWPPALGIFGNSHMFMLDKNNLELADLVLKWIKDNVGLQNLAAN